ncbi:hypothetical protein J2X72_001399 [Phyllobacterium sp. 1468]|uniref:hypothetical protein n=1 Tax=Phyllobacterium sp. 1468 TaxID=2817759 RepID=UPI0028546C2B|nr:hypothetical protein [Phyllobacterium sp. 1468]MDR6632615.1 hypothetical protein [Phyllobacterium sp. 1468]
MKSRWTDGIAKPKVLKSLFDQGVSFHKAALKCLPFNGMPADLLVEPGVVNLAFAIECYLKGFSFHENDEPAIGHELDSLYFALSDALRGKILKCYLTVPFLNSTELDKCVKAMATAFVDWRYVFEKKELSVSFGEMFDFARALHETAVAEGIFATSGFLEDLKRPQERVLEKSGHRLR